jgi:hypothetical protein
LTFCAVRCHTVVVDVDVAVFDAVEAMDVVQDVVLLLEVEFASRRCCRGGDFFFFFDSSCLLCGRQHDLITVPMIKRQEGVRDMMLTCGGGLWIVEDTRR